jgi:hypothetical protein
MKRKDVANFLFWLTLAINTLAIFVESLRFLGGVACLLWGVAEGIPQRALRIIKQKLRRR